MPKATNLSQGSNDIAEIKSKFDAEFRRFSINRSRVNTFDDFFDLVMSMHRLQENDYILAYTDPVHGDLLPINNNDNYARAISTAKPLLRLFVQRKGDQIRIFDTHVGKNNKSKSKLNSLQIGLPSDFRKVSSIVDADVLPVTQRRVKLVKGNSNKPLGFYIRDGISIRVTSSGIEKVPGIFISRLISGGLAASTGLLAVNDEVLEVNGIEVAGKTLDQVTDMMVANSQNLIITVRPSNQEVGVALPQEEPNFTLPPTPQIVSASQATEQTSGDRVSRTSQDETGNVYESQQTEENLSDQVQDSQSNEEGYHQEPEIVDDNESNDNYQNVGPNIQPEDDSDQLPYDGSNIPADATDDAAQHNHMYLEEYDQVPVQEQNEYEDTDQQQQYEHATDEYYDALQDHNYDPQYQMPSQSHELNHQELNVNQLELDDLSGDEV